MHEIACFYVYNKSSDKEKSKEFLRGAYPNLLWFHRFLICGRDPEKSRLVKMFHPLESGRDDSVVWDDAIARITFNDLPKFELFDVKTLNGAKRPTNEEYDKIIYLIELMKDFNYGRKALYV